MKEIWIIFWKSVFEYLPILIGSAGLIILAWWISTKEVNKYQKRKDENLLKIEILKQFNPIIPQLYVLTSSRDKEEFNRNQKEMIRAMEGYMNLVPLINLHYTTDIGIKIENSMKKITKKISEIGSTFSSDPDKKEVLEEVNIKIDELGEILGDIYSIVINTPFNK